ncbi:MAG: hypothetical protein GX951_03395 [Mollicutes bacterium]|nr:hypothetical protein [Mollicutes bacterium]
MDFQFASVEKIEKFSEILVKSFRYDLISICDETVEDYIVEKYGDYIVRTISVTFFSLDLYKTSPRLTGNDKLLKKAIEFKRYDLVTKFKEKAYTDETLQMILEIFDKLPDEWLEKLWYNEKFFRLAMNLKRYDIVCRLNPSLIECHSSKEEQKELFDWMANKKEFILPDNLLYSGLFKDICYYNNLENFCNKIVNYSKRNRIPEKTPVEKFTALYAHFLAIDPYQIKEKIESLVLIDSELLSYLNPLMLETRMNIFSSKYFHKICTSPKLQYKVVSLTNGELLLLNRMLKIIDTMPYDTSSISYNVINHFLYYKGIINNSENVTDEQLINYIYILQKAHNFFGIQNIEDLKDNNFLGIITKKYKQYELRIKEAQDISNLKNMLLLKKYGFDLKESLFILNRYFKDKNLVLNLQIDENVKLILFDIYDIVNCNDIEELMFMFSASDMMLPSFNNYLYLEVYLRNEYAKLYDSTLYYITDDEKLDNNEGLIGDPKILGRLRSINNNQSKIFLLKDDFNLLIHVLGAYSDYSRKGSFLDDWNRPELYLHGISCSYIGNNQIATARVFYPILGFNNLNGKELLMSTDTDANSNWFKHYYDISRNIDFAFSTPSELINNTRHTHNEVLIERMKYEDGKILKRMPSYIIYIIDDINNKYNFMTRKELIKEFEVKNISKDVIKLLKEANDAYFVYEMLIEHKISKEDTHKIRCVYYYEQSLQAAKDMNLPIVIVDRLYFAKKEMDKCYLIYEQLLQTKDPSYLSLLIITYFNNIIGCHDYNDGNLEYNKYFNAKGFKKMFEIVIEGIKNINDNTIKYNHLTVLLKELTIEIEKRKKEKGDFRHLIQFQNIVKDEIERLQTKDGKEEYVKSL